MYIEIKKGNKKYYLDTFQKFSEEFIEDFDIEDMNDFCEELEDIIDYDYKYKYRETFYIKDYELIKITYSDTKEFLVKDYFVIEAFKFVLDDCVIKEITEYYYASMKDYEQPYRCENTIDMFEKKE